MDYKNKKVINAYLGLECEVKTETNIYYGIVRYDSKCDVLMVEKTEGGLIGIPINQIKSIMVLKS